MQMRRKEHRTEENGRDKDKFEQMKARLDLARAQTSNEMNYSQGSALSLEE